MRAQLVRQLELIISQEQDLLAGCGLFAMLQLHQAELCELLDDRDHRVASCADRFEHAEILEHRDMYLLATRTIELQSMLEKRPVTVLKME